MDEITEKIYTGTDGPNRDLPFADWVEFLAEHYERDRKIRTGLRVAPACRRRWGGASDTSGLSTYERQCLQVDKARRRDPNPYFDGEGLNAEMTKWVYPLHFIDFETTQVAIPFNRGMPPTRVSPFSSPITGSTKKAGSPM